MSNNININDEPSDLDWVQLRREMGTVQHTESTSQKFARKFTENPFVPIGKNKKKRIYKVT